MELNLQPSAPVCRLSGRAFQPGDAIASYLVREPAGEIARQDVLVAEEGGFTAGGFVFCRWVHVHKVKPADENPERALKLTAENLFLTLADPANEPDAGSVPLLQFLALMLERKRLLRPRGRTADGARWVYEHARTKQLFEVPAGDLTPEFFAKIQEQLGVLVGMPPAKNGEPGAEAAAAGVADGAARGA